MSGTQYTITYNTLGGSAVADTVGRDIVTLRETIPTRTGYTFVAWYASFEMNGAAYPPGSNYRLILDTTLFAKWSSTMYTLTYEPQGGSSVDSNTQNAGTVITLATTALEGYTFNGWFDSESSGNLVGRAGDSYTINTTRTLYAQWTAVQYTLTYEPQGGSAVAPTTQNAGTQITPLPTPTFTGRTFNGWFTASSGGSLVTSPYTLNASVTLYAQWTAIQYTLTYETQGGSAVDPTTQNAGTQITPLPTPTFTGRTFNGWFTASSGGTAVLSPYTLNASATIYAQWTAIQYTLTYDTQSGSAVAPTTQNAGTQINLAAAPTRTHYTFVEWKTTLSQFVSGTSYSPGQAYVLNGSATLYAVWQRIVYTLTYNLQDGSPPFEGPVFSGDTITVNSIPTRRGYTFNGWNTAANGRSTAYSPGQTRSITGDFTLYALWSSSTYTITYVSQGGSAVPPDTQNVGTPAIIASGPTPTLNWTFAQWNTVSDGSGMRYNAGATYSLDVDLTLYAQWTATLTYNTQGGPGLLQNTGQPGSSLYLPTEPPLTGYTFRQWNTSANGLGTPYAAGGLYILAENATIYAIWDANVPMFSLTYDSQRGSVVWPMIASAGSSIRLADAPSRSGYTFLGWFSAPSGGSLVGSPLTLNNYVTLYAQWYALPISIEGGIPETRNCPLIRTRPLLFPRNRFLQRCCPSPVYSITAPTVDLNGIVQFVSSYPMFGTDMYRITATNNQPDNLLIAYQKYYKNSPYGYDTGVLAYPGVSFNITVVPFQDGIPRVSYTIPFTTLTPQPPLLVTATQSGISSAFLQWLVPESDQYVSTITSYIIRYGASMQTASSNSAVISGLASGTYTFTVQGSNMAGLGTVSTPAVLSM